MKTKILTLNIYSLIILSLIIRSFAAYFFADRHLDNEWGILIHNLELSGILGINIVLNEFSAVPGFANLGDKVLPSAFMPPLYAFFIFFFKKISFDLVNIVDLIIIIQILIGVFTIYFFFKISKYFFSAHFSLFLTSIFSIFPLNVYAVTQISSVTLQIFLFVLFLFYLIEFIEKKELKHIILFSIISGLSILLRGEFVIFYLLTLVYFFIIYSKNFKFFLISLFITLITISPYLKRNYDNFNSLVITKSFGYNLLKGNNYDLKVEGSTEFIIENFNQKDLKIRTKEDFEIQLDNLYRKYAINIIKEDPYTYLGLYIKKVFSLLFIDLNSSYKNYYNLFNVAPNILISLTSFIGAIMLLRKKGFFQFLALYYFLNVCLFSVFFILPRYGLMLLPVKIFLSYEIFKYLKRKLIN